MSFFGFLLEAALVSASGVLAPGPMTAVTVGKGSDSPYAGSLIAVGHGLVELPLILLVSYGLGRWLALGAVRIAIGLLGGMFLLAMGFSMLRSLGRLAFGSSQHARSPLVAGALLSIGNPYFLVWWATVGAAMVVRAVAFGVWGLAAFALLHWLCDFAWCTLLSVLSFRGGRLFGRRLQVVLFASCGVALLFFGGKFILQGMRAWLV